MTSTLDRAARWYADATSLRRRWLGRGTVVPGLAVVSVGGLRAGGVGKSPTARAVARTLTGAGVPTVIVLRGYGGRARGPREVRDGDRPEDVGDEALEHHAAGHAVVVARERAKGAALARALGARAVVLDDGFQHVALARDLDVVMVAPGDAHAAVLPAGPLREPLAALAHADELATVDEACERLAGRLVHRCSVALAALRDGRGAREHPARWRGARALVVTGVARPERVAATLAREGLRVVEHRQFPDHAPLPPDALACGADVDVIVVTGKDAARGAARAPRDARVRVADIEVALAPALARRVTDVAAHVGSLEVQRARRMFPPV